MEAWELLAVALDPYFSRFVGGHFCGAMETRHLSSVAAAAVIYLIMVIVGFIIVLAHFAVVGVRLTAELLHLIAVNFPIVKRWFQIPLLDLV